MYIWGKNLLHQTKCNLNYYSQPLLPGLFHRFIGKIFAKQVLNNKKKKKIESFFGSFHELNTNNGKLANQFLFTQNYILKNCLISKICKIFRFCNSCDKADNLYSKNNEFRHLYVFFFIYTSGLH